jgi:hypothetical protein
MKKQYTETEFEHLTRGQQKAVRMLKIPVVPDEPESEADDLDDEDDEDDGPPDEAKQWDGELASTQDRPVPSGRIEAPSTGPMTRQELIDSWRKPAVAEQVATPATNLNR